MGTPKNLVGGCMTEVARASGAGRVRSVRLAHCGYQRGEKRRLNPKRGPSVADERLTQRTGTLVSPKR
jgi:hypothetical protein